MLYKDMTPEQRREAYEEQMEAVEVHAQCFAVRPPRGTRLDHEAQRHADKCTREAAFILRVAKSLGDGWVTKL